MSTDLLSWLIIGHLVGDFLFQTRWMAENKVSRWNALLLHCFVYTLTVALFARLIGGLSWFSLLVIFVSHVILDRRKWTQYWLRTVNKSEDMFWLTIVHDQTWHLLVLAVVVFLQAA